MMPAAARPTLWLWIYLTTLLVVMVLAMCVGSYPVGLPELWQQMLGQTNPTQTQIVLDVRLPRVLLGALCGACLGAATPLLQASFRTQLADPYLLGLAGFAALGAVLLQNMGLAGFGTPVLASFGALLAIGLLQALSNHTNNERRALVGVALAAIGLAGLAVLLALSQSPSSTNIVGWVVGGFYATGWTQVLAMLWLAVPALVLALLLGRTANLLQLGDEIAQNLGLNAAAARLGLLLLAATLTGVGVGSAGMLGFVGLVATSWARQLWGTKLQHLLPAAAIIGAGLIVASDALGRLLIAPNEIPAGAFTTLLGGAYLVLLSRRAT